MTSTSIFRAFPYTYRGQIRLIPEPDPVPVYFHLAYVNYRLIDEKKKAILKLLLNPVVGEPMINEWYEHFGLASGFVIFLFTTLEAFVNSRIPNNYEYKRVDKRVTEIFNKQQVEEYISFNEKNQNGNP